MKASDKITASITGLGSCLPRTKILNSNLEEVLDTSDEWIVQRTGIKERRFACSDEPLPVLMAAASVRALEDAKKSADDIDYIIVGTNQTDPLLVPNLSSRIQYLISNSGYVPCFDISAGCTGAVAATEVAVRIIRDRWYSEKHKHTNVLVVGGDTLSKVTSIQDRRSAVILADGAGAMLLETEFDVELGVQSLLNKCNGSRGYLIHYGYTPYNQFEGLSPLRFANEEILAGKGESRFKPFVMDGKAVHKFIAANASDLIRETMETAGLPIKLLEETTVIPHQMNLKSIEMLERKVQKELGYSPKLVYKEGICRYGNTSPASTIIGMDELQREGKLNIYDLVMTISFGAGLTWGGFLTRWGKYAKNYQEESRKEELVSELNRKYEHWKEKLAK